VRLSTWRAASSGFFLMSHGIRPALRARLKSSHARSSVPRWNRSSRSQWCTAGYFAVDGESRRLADPIARKNLLRYRVGSEGRACSRACAAPWHEPLSCVVRIPDILLTYMDEVTTVGSTTAERNCRWARAGAGLLPRPLHARPDYVLSHIVLSAFYSRSQKQTWRGRAHRLRTPDSVRDEVGGLEVCQDRWLSVSAGARLVNQHSFRKKAIDPCPFVAFCESSSGALL